VAVARRELESGRGIGPSGPIGIGVRDQRHTALPFAQGNVGGELQQLAAAAVTHMLCVQVDAANVGEISEILKRDCAHRLRPQRAKAEIATPEIRVLPPFRNLVLIHARFDQKGAIPFGGGAQEPCDRLHVRQVCNDSSLSSLQMYRMMTMSRTVSEYILALANVSTSLCG
jgi:hypothetical protein